jgi:HK97 gp10 family phage protein
MPLQSVQVVLDPLAIAALGMDAGVRDYLMEVGDRIADDARGHAARAPAHRGPSSGHGADSIHAEASHEDGNWVVDVGWDRDHYYMRFVELGTRHMPARPFLRPAFDRYAPA